MGPYALDEEHLPEIKRSPWVDNFFRPALITAMIMCLNVALVNATQLLNPTWRSTYFLAGMLLTTVEAIYSYRVLKQWRSRGISTFQYRLAEGVLLFVILKLLSLANNPLPQIWLELQQLGREPWTILTIEFYIILILATIAWVAATSTIANFEALYDPYSFRSDHIIPLSELKMHFFIGGIFLVAISGVTRWIAVAGVDSLSDFQRPSLNGIIANVLLYFVLGLVLLSQANLTRLLVRWRVQKIEVPPTFMQTLARYALGFLLLVALIIFFIPTSYTLGLLASAAIVVQLLLGLIIFIGQLLLFLISLPIFWLMSLFGDSPPAEQLPAMAPPVFRELATAEESTSVPWYDAIRSLVFWLIGLGILLYFAKAYLDDHPELWQSLRKLKGMQWLKTLFTHLWEKLSDWTQAGLEMLPESLKFGRDASEASGTGGPGWFGFGRLSPRERVMTYYRNILERMAKQGVRRQTSQTPYEVEPLLRQKIPDTQTEIEELTEAYVQARYSRTAIDKKSVAKVKPLWLRIKRALRRIKRG